MTFYKAGDGLSCLQLNMINIVQVDNGAPVREVKLIN